MFFNWRRYGLALLALVLVSCEEQSSQSNLPVSPQILLARPDDGIRGFALIPRNEKSTLTIMLFNGGQKPLLISSLAIEGGGGAFNLGEVLPASREVLSNEALIAPVTFTSLGRGVYHGVLVVKSNAENQPELKIDLFGPGADTVIPDEPDIQVFQSEVQLTKSPNQPDPLAYVGYYNLGKRSLRVKKYLLNDATNFAFTSGAKLPGEICTYGAVCQSNQAGCCSGGLSCLCTTMGENQICQNSLCGDVIISSGRFESLLVSLAAAANLGEHATDLLIYTGTNEPGLLSADTRERGQDADTPIATVHLTGTRE